MKRIGVRMAVALAIGACALAGSTATAQVTIGARNAVQAPGASAGYAVGVTGAQTPSGTEGVASVTTSDDLVAGVGSAFVVNRFGARDGRIVAYGRLVPTVGDVELGAAGATGARPGWPTSRSGVLLSTPAEPAGGYGADPRLGMGTRIAYSDIIVTTPYSGSGSASASLGSATSSGTSLGAAATYGANPSYDPSRLGDWTGIGGGYGESGVESRSNMTSDIDGTTSFNLGRPYDDQSYMEDLTWGGSQSTWSSSDLALSSDQEMLGDGEMLSASSASSTVTVATPTLSVTASRPLVQLGGSQGLYTSAEAQRSLMLGASEDIAVPVTVVGASCDAVSLSFAGGAETVTITSLDGGEKLGATLCDLTEAASTPASEGQTAMLLKHLNRLISRVE